MFLVVSFQPSICTCNCPLYSHLSARGVKNKNSVKRHQNCLKIYILCQSREKTNILLRQSSAVQFAGCFNVLWMPVYTNSVWTCSMIHPSYHTFALKQFKAFQHHTRQYKGSTALCSHYSQYTDTVQLVTASRHPCHAHNMNTRHGSSYECCSALQFCILCMPMKASLYWTKRKHHKRKQRSFVNR